MSRYEKYETLAQQVFVAEQKRYRRRIAAGRFLLLFLLLIRGGRHGTPNCYSGSCLGA